MSGRSLNVVAWTIGGIAALVGGCLWVALFGLAVIIVLGGVNEIASDGWPPAWQKLAILLTFVLVFLMRRRLSLLDNKIDEIRMMTASTCCYLDIEFRNRRLDLPPGAVHLVKDDFRQGLFRDKLLTGCYAAREQRRVTLADDLKIADRV
jgi:hypothetical protein